MQTKCVTYKNRQLFQIPGYSSNYVDKKGNIYVYHESTETFKKIKPHDDHRGYLIVGCKRDSTGKQYPLKVHHAVLETFVGPRPTPVSVARHLDDNSFNNAVDNLKWGTTGENQKDKMKNRSSSLSDKRKTSKEKKAILKQMKKDGYTVREMTLITGWKKGIVQSCLV